MNADELIDNRGLNTQNLYAYCANNPVNMVDPDGALWDYIKDTYNRVKNFVKSVVNKIEEKLTVKYDVPLYNQNQYPICWAVCLVMIRDFNNDKKRTNTSAF